MNQITEDVAEIEVRISGTKVNMLRGMREMPTEQAVGAAIEMGMLRYQELPEHSQIAAQQYPGYAAGIQILNIIRHPIPVRSIVRCRINSLNYQELEMVGTLVGYSGAMAQVRLTPASLTLLNARRNRLGISAHSAEDHMLFALDEIEEL